MVVGEVLGGREFGSSSASKRGGDERRCANESEDLLDRGLLSIAWDRGSRPLPSRTFRSACWASPESSSFSGRSPEGEPRLGYVRSEFISMGCRLGVVLFHSSAAVWYTGRLAGPRDELAQGDTLLDCDDAAVEV